MCSADMTLTLIANTVKEIFFFLHTEATPQSRLYSSVSVSLLGCGTLLAHRIYRRATSPSSQLSHTRPGLT